MFLNYQQLTSFKTWSNQRLESAFEVHVKGKISSTVVLYKFYGIERLDTYSGS